jgi:hypothetical protein
VQCSAVLAMEIKFSKVQKSACACSCAFSITKYYNIEIQPSSIAQSTGYYFPVKVHLYWKCTGKYTPSGAGGIFSSILSLELGVYWKI